MANGRGSMGVTDPKHKYTVGEMAKGDVMFAATGVTSGAMLKGVRRFTGRCVHAFDGDAEQVGDGALRSRRTTTSQTKTWQPE